MKKAACLLMITLLLVPVFPAASARAATTQEELFHTYDFFGLRFDVCFVEDAAILYLPDGPLVLPQALSASGARFTDGKTTFWIKGENAYMEINGSVARE